MLTFELVHPNQLRTVWHRLRLGLDRVLEKSYETWIPEDIYADARSGLCFVYDVCDDGVVVGGTVLKPQPTGVLVWAAWGMIEKHEGYMAALREEVKKMGATRVFFETNRKGWWKIAPKFGFRPRMWVAEV